MRWLLVLTAGMTSCAKLSREKEEKEQPFGPTGVPEHLRGQGTADIMGNPSQPAAQPSAALRNLAAHITPDEDIVFTDPDNPDADIPELSALLAEERSGPWEESETVAKRKAMRQGKPLLIWFTDSARSPMCKAISEELFAKHEFGDWANEKIIRLKIDSNYRITDPNLSMDEKTQREINVKNYVESLKKRYKVLGHPVLVMLNSSGEVIGRYRGYKRGEADYYWGLMKQAEVASGVAYQGWRQNLEKKGYREWKDRRGRKIFAKLLQYSKGELVLLEPDGTRSRTKESQLSSEDRSWIEEQLQRRGVS